MSRVAAIPSPTRSLLEFGPLTIHFYALTIIIGVIVAITWGSKRYQSIGGDRTAVSDVAIYAIPAGVIGGRIYHVITTPELYFGSGKNPISALYIWQGGLGIWGAIALGYLGAYIGWQRSIRNDGLSFLKLVDALAPGIVIAQGIGRWGNWFNRELFGKPTDLPWGLSIPRIDRPSGYQEFELFHPTFLYEFLWCLAVAWLLTRIKLESASGGTVFLTYVGAYSFGRIWIEAIRIDDAHHIIGLRLNVWVAISLFVISTLLLIKRSQTRFR